MTKEVQEIIKKFKDKGYTIKEVSKPWRSTVAFLERKNKLFILKIVQSNDSTVNKISDHSLIVDELKNQVLWEREAGGLIANKNLPVIIPKTYEYEFSRNIGYILQEYIKGEKIEEAKDFDRWVNPFCETLHYFNSIPIDRVNFVPEKVPAYKWLIGKIKKWSEAPLQEKVIKKLDVEKVCDITEQAKTLLHFGLEHGDFSPRHLIAYRYPVFGLIDAEKGGVNKAAYYDVAYFYPKIYLRLNNPVLAKKFLKRFMEGLKESPENFSKQFMPLLISRAIGTITDYILRDRNFDDSTSLEKRVIFFYLTLKNDINLLSS